MSEDRGYEPGSTGIDRRRFSKAVLVSGLAGLAGCSGGSGTPTDGGGQPGDDGSDGAGDGTDGSDSTTEQEPVREAIRQIGSSLPNQSQLNPWGTTLENHPWFYFTELVSPRLVTDSDRTLWSGHTWESPWIDDREEIEVHTYIEDFEIDPPYAITYTIDDEMRYWDGTDIDAEAWHLHERLDFLQQGGRFDDTMSHNVAVEDTWTVRTWRDRGDAPEQTAKPTNEFILRSEAGRENVPFHPSFTRPWVERFEDAGGESATEDLAEELSGEVVSFSDAAAEGYGSGLYEIRSPDDISSDRILAHLREDHPNAEHATIETLHLFIGERDRRTQLINRGRIDIGDGIIQEEGGRHNRQTLPDHIQELARYLDNGGDQLLFNNSNPHLGHTANGVPWVRRAVVAAVDWEAVGANGWGPERSLPLEYDTGMLKSVAESYFEPEFLESLHRYPRGPDQELATEWMERAGYTKRGGVWTSPDGEAVSLQMVIVSDISDWVGAAQTIRANLQDFGFEFAIDGITWEAYQQRLNRNDLGYDVAIQWGHNGVNVWNVYWSSDAWFSDPLVGGDPDSGGGAVDPETTEEDDHDTVDNQGNPLEVEIPREVGALTLDGETESIDIADLVHTFRREDITEEEMLENARKCARYYNFYLPDYMFHQYNWGYWGNVRDFEFPEKGHQIYEVRTGFEEEYPVLAGVPQLKYDTDYEPP